MLSFVTPNGWAMLGISASMEFMRVMDPTFKEKEEFSIERIQTIIQIDLQLHAP